MRILNPDCHNMDEEYRKSEWIKELVPIYGHRETKSMWKIYRESDRVSAKFTDDLKKLKAQFPIQYLIGYTWFYDLKVFVDPAVLIPRPETEELVYYILDRVQDADFTVMDLGTGSGCISLALKKNKPGWEIIGIDNSLEALRVAKINAQYHNLDIHWSQGDMLDWNWNATKKSNIIVSNPPYIPLGDKSKMGGNVIFHEPESALFTADRNGLEYYLSICRNSWRQLKIGGWIFLEIHEEKGKDIVEMFESEGKYEEIEIIKDMQGKDRIFCCRSVK